jgi:hypothetical protein
MDSNSDLRRYEAESDLSGLRKNPRTRVGRMRSRLWWLRPFEIRITTPRRSIDRINWELYHEFD